jgi:hypothetical protein
VRRCGFLARSLARSLVRLSIMNLSMILEASIQQFKFAVETLRTGPGSMKVPIHWTHWSTLSPSATSHAFSAPIWLLIFWFSYFLSTFVLWLAWRIHVSRPLDQALRLLAFLHNLVLSAWSGVMFLGAASAVVAVTRSDGSIERTFCSSSFDNFPRNIYYWLYMFYLSKPVEFFDTFLLAARGKPLTVLHVWHHASVVFETWSWLRYGLNFSIYGMLFNTAIHTIMYMYFAYASMQWRFPWKRWITLLQIVQFITSFALTIPYLYLYWRNPQRCMGMPALAISTFCNASYLLLFLRFYRRTYWPVSKAKD